MFTIFIASCMSQPLDMSDRVKYSKYTVHSLQGSSMNLLLSFKDEINGVNTVHEAAAMQKIH